MNNYQIKELKYPTQQTDATSKQYVLDVFIQSAGGLSTISSLDIQNQLLPLNSDLVFTSIGNPQNYKVLVDNPISNKQVANKSYVDQNDSVLQSQINDEQSTRIAQDLILQTQVTSNSSELTQIQTNIVDITNDINSEQAERLNQDELLQTNVDTVYTNLTSEIANRQTADTTLQNNINTNSAKTIDTLPKAQANLDLNNQSIINGNLINATRFVGTLNGDAYKNYPSTSSQYQTLNDVTLSVNTATATLSSQISNLQTQLGQKATIDFGTTTQTIGGNLYMANSETTRPSANQIYYLPKISPTIYNQSGYTVSQKSQPITADALVLWSPNNLNVCSGNLDLNINKITNLATPATNLDATNKQYCDANLASAKTYDDNNLVTAKAYTDTQIVLKRNKADTLQTIFTDNPISLNMTTNKIQTTATVFTANDLISKSYADLSYSAFGSSSGSSSSSQMSYFFMQKKGNPTSNNQPFNDAQNTMKNYSNNIVSYTDITGVLILPAGNYQFNLSQRGGNDCYISFQYFNTTANGWVFLDDSTNFINSAATSHTLGTNTNVYNNQCIMIKQLTQQTQIRIYQTQRGSVTLDMMQYSVIMLNQYAQASNMNSSQLIINSDINLFTSGNRIQGADPISSQDYVTKSYLTNNPASAVPTQIRNSVNYASCLQADAFQLTNLGTPIQMSNQQILGLQAATLDLGATNLKQVRDMITSSGSTTTLSLSNLPVLSNQPINCNYQKIIHCANPIASDDVVVLSYLQQQISNLSLSNLVGYPTSNISANFNRVTNVSSAINGQDAANFGQVQQMILNAGTGTGISASYCDTLVSVEQTRAMSVEASQQTQITAIPISITANNATLVTQMNAQNSATITQMNAQDASLQTQISAIATPTKLDNGLSSLYYSAANILRSKYNSLSTFAQSTGLNTFLHEFNISEFDLYDNVSGSTLWQCNQTNIHQTVPLVISAFTSTLPNANLYVNKSGGSKLGQQYCARFIDGNMTNGGVQMDALLNCNATVNINNGCNLNTNINMLNGSSIIMPINSGTQSQIIMNNGHITGNAVNTSNILVGFNNNTSETLISASGTIEAVSYRTIVIASDERCKTNIQLPDMSGLESVDFVDFDYNVDWLVQNNNDVQTYSEERIRQIVSLTKQSGFIAQRTPERYQIPSYINDQLLNVKYDKLKDDLFSYLLVERRRMQKQLMDQESRLKYIESYLFSKLE